MILQDIIKELSLNVVNLDKASLEKKVTGGYVSDLLSNVMANAKSDNIWVTMQGHQNIIAVAMLTGVVAIIVSKDAKIDQATIDKATDNNVTVLSTNMSSFDTVGKLYKLGIVGDA